MRIQDWEDELIWSLAPHGRYTPKEGYSFIFVDHEPDNSVWWRRLLWKLKGSIKEKIFMWCFLYNKSPTGDNLQ